MSLSRGGSLAVTEPSAHSEPFARSALFSLALLLPATSESFCGEEVGLSFISTSSGAARSSLRCVEQSAAVSAVPPCSPTRLSKLSMTSVSAAVLCLCGIKPTVLTSHELSSPFCSSRSLNSCSKATSRAEFCNTLSQAATRSTRGSGLHT
uniref:Uncharacterized protein n=1 Tax=Scleropages formosus TaxID=113540 RepID=A0A8C9RLJ7_SCLFO